MVFFKMTQNNTRKMAAVCSCSTARKLWVAIPCGPGGFLCGVCMFHPGSLHLLQLLPTVQRHALGGEVSQTVLDCEWPSALNCLRWFPPPTKRWGKSGDKWIERWRCQYAIMWNLSWVMNHLNNNTVSTPETCRNSISTIWYWQIKASSSPLDPNG